MSFRPYAKRSDNGGRSRFRSALRRRCRGLLGAVLAAVLTGSSCNGDDQSARPPSVVFDGAVTESPPFDLVCGLVTRGEIEAVLGAQVVGKPRVPPPHAKSGVIGARDCMISDAKGGTVFLGLAWRFASDVFDKAVVGIQNTHATRPVRNLGDEAVAFFGGYLLVRDNGYVLYIGVSPQGRPPTDRLEAAPAATREAYVGLALKALERLPESGRPSQ